jgi:hypothetical protein
VPESHGIQPEDAGAALQAKNSYFILEGKCGVMIAVSERIPTTRLSCDGEVIPICEDPDIVNDCILMQSLNLNGRTHADETQSSDTPFRILTPQRSPILDKSQIEDSELRELETRQEELIDRYPEVREAFDIAGKVAILQEARKEETEDESKALWARRIKFYKTPKIRAVRDGYNCSIRANSVL